MAQEIAEIYDDYWSELQNQPELNALQPQVDDAQTLLSDLNSPSHVAEHRLWVWLFSVFTWMQQKRFDSHYAEVEAIANANRWGTRPWWEAIIKTYQHGYSLLFINDRPAYAVIDEAARPVKRVAVVSLGGGAFQIKIAGDGTSLDPITAPGVAQGVAVFADMLAGPGPDITIVALAADRLRLSAEIFYDPLVIAPDGQSIMNPGTYPVEDAINIYLSSLPFNGVMNLTHLKDAVQAVEGVNDIVITSAIGIQGSNTVSITRLYQTISGWMVENDAPGEHFRDLITYTSGE